MTGRDLTQQTAIDLKWFFRDNPETVLIIDFQKGDGAIDGRGNHHVFVDESGKLNLKKEHIPGRVFEQNGFKKLVISNVTGDITSIGDYFLYECTHIEELDLNGLSKVISLGVKFLEKCSIKTIRLANASAVVREGYDKSLKNQQLFQG